MLLGGLIDTLTGANKSARLKGTVVLMRKNVLDLNDFGATIMDGIGEFLGKGVTCQLISSTLVDHDNGGRGKVGAEAELEQWVTSLPSLTMGESKFGLTFDWEVDKLGVPGAIVVNNYHSSEFLLKTVTLHDVPGRGNLTFIANSWIYPVANYRYSRQRQMKKGLFPTKDECFFFGEENRLKIFQPNTFNFKPKAHIKLDEVQRCILDNFWFQYTNKRDEKGYMLSILNSLAEYFNQMNMKAAKLERSEIQKGEILYVLFDGNKPGIYFTWEDIMIEKLDAKQMGQDLIFKKYDSIDDALFWARKMIGENYYIDPKAKDYIQKRKNADNNASNKPIFKITKGESSGKNMKEEGSPKNYTYKECLLKGLDPLDSEYIDQEMDKRFEELSKRMKKELKEEILEEIRVEMKIRFEDIKKECDSKYDFHLLDEDHIDIAGHGQPPE